MNGTQYTSGGIHVINKAGTTLPSTGGIGTTIFYLIGGGLMVAAAVLLMRRSGWKTSKTNRELAAPPK